MDQPTHKSNLKRINENVEPIDGAHVDSTIYSLQSTTGARNQPTTGKSRCGSNSRKQAPDQDQSPATAQSKAQVNSKTVACLKAYVCRGVLQICRRLKTCDPVSVGGLFRIGVSNWRFSCFCWSPPIAKNKRLDERVQHPFAPSWNLLI